MNNALVYLFFIKIKGSIRNILKNKIKLLFTLVAVGLTIFGMVKSMQNPVTNNFLKDVSILNLGGGAFLYLMLLVMLLNKQSALVYQNDANFIFAGPFKRKTIMNYLLGTNITSSITIAVGFLLYCFIFFSSTIKGLPHALGLTLSVFLHFIFIMFYFTYNYIKTAANENAKGTNRLFIIILSILIVLMILWMMYPNFTIDSLLAIGEHPYFKWIPYIGTFAWISNMFILNDVTALIPISIMMGVSSIFLVGLYNTKENFIEKAIHDAEFISARLAQAKDGSSEITLSIDSDKLKGKQFKITFLEGAWSLFSKQWLMLKKTKRFLPLGNLIMIVIYGVIGLFIQEIPVFKGMIAFSLFIGSDTGLLLEELNRPYIYLIPDSEFKKLISTLIIPFLRVALLLVILTGILLAIGDPWPDALSFLFLSLSLYAIILMVDCLSIKLLNTKKSMLIQVYIKFFFVILSLLPAIAMILLYGFLSKDYTTWIVFMIGTIINFTVAGLGLYFSRTILKGNNLSD